VDRLLFPVKLGPELSNVHQDFWSTGQGESAARGAIRMRAGKLGRAWLFGLALLPGCGYVPVYGSSSTKYEVVAGQYGTASFEAVGETVSGMRAELGASGALGQGRRVSVEVLRVDERSIGIRPVGNAPLARGSEIVVVGRARVYDSSESTAPRWDTGDMSRAAQYAAGSSPEQDAAERNKAVREAARALGRAMARAVLGLPEPAEG